MNALIELLAVFVFFTLGHIAFEGPWYVTFGDCQRDMAFSNYVTGMVFCTQVIVWNAKTDRWKKCQSKKSRRTW